VAEARPETGSEGDPPGTDAPAPTPRPPRRAGLVGPFSGRQIAAAAVTVLAVAVVLLVATAPLGATGTDPTAVDPRATPYLLSTPPPEGVRPGSTAPELEVVGPDGALVPLTDLDGHPVRLADLRGRLVWLNFWASWCPPCQAETPVLREMAGRYEDDGLTIVGISVQESSEADVRDYAARYALGYTIAADLAGDVFRTYKVFALPTQFFIGPDGVVQEVVNGPLETEDAATLVERLLP
jgi:thiol-disulfide isomerase/thioredoxin